MGVRDRIASSITDIQNRGRRLVELNIELIRSELKRKGQQYGAAAALFAAAGLLALYGLGFALATIAVALYIVLPLWLSLLIVTAALFLIVLILALIGRSRVRAAQKPVAVKPAEEARKSLDMAKAQLQQTAKSAVPKRSSVTLGPRAGAGGAPSWSPPPPPPGSSGPLSTASSEPTRPGPTPPSSPTGPGSTPPPSGPGATPPPSGPGTPPTGEASPPVTTAPPDTPPAPPSTGGE